MYEDLNAILHCKIARCFAMLCCKMAYITFAITLLCT